MGQRGLAGLGLWQTHVVCRVFAPGTVRNWLTGWLAPGRPWCASPAARVRRWSISGSWAVLAVSGRWSCWTTGAPVLLVAGEYDIWPTCASVRALAALLGNAELALLPRGGHFPWVDDPVSFAATVHEFLARRPAPSSA